MTTTHDVTRREEDPLLPAIPDENPLARQEPPAVASRQQGPTIVSSRPQPTHYGHRPDLDAAALSLLSHRRPADRRAPRAFEALTDIHAWPGLTVAALTGTGMWAHTEPLHLLFTGVFSAAGTGLITVAALGHHRHGQDADKAITRGWPAAAIGCFGAAAATGAGFSGIGVMGGIAGLAVAYKLWHDRVREHTLEDREFVTRYATATAPTPLPHGAPLPAAYTPTQLQPTSPEEARLISALSALGADGATVGVIHTIEAGVSWSVIVRLPQGKSFSIAWLQRRRNALMSNLGCRNVLIQPAAAKDLIRLTVFDGEDPLLEWEPHPGPTITSIEQPVPLADCEDGSHLEVETLWKHILMAGMTDAGKSGLLNGFIVATLACRDLVRIGIDCKDGSPELGPFRAVMFHLAKSPAEAMQVIAGVREMVRERGLILEEASARRGEPVKKWEPAFGPYFHLIIDELAELVREYPEATKDLESLRQVMRYVGGHEIDATQSPGAQVFGNSTAGRQQYSLRFGLMMAEPVAINSVFGAGAQGQGWLLNELDIPGTFMLKSRTHQHPIRYRDHFLTDKQIAEWVTQYTPTTPKLDERSAEAFRRGYANYKPKPGSSNPPPAGRTRQLDEDEADGFEPGTVAQLHLVPAYKPDPRMDKAAWRALWAEFEALGEATIDELVDLGIEGATSRDSVGKALRAWEKAGHAFSEKEGRGKRFYVRPSDRDEGHDEQEAAG